MALTANDYKRGYRNPHARTSVYEQRRIATPHVPNDYATFCRPSGRIDWRGCQAANDYNRAARLGISLGTIAKFHS